MQVGAEDDKVKQVKSFERELDQLCPHLYFDKHHLAYCPKFGWIDLVRDMSLKLEMLNVQLKRYGARVVIDQCKDKFGMLRVYAEATLMVPWHAEVIVNALDRIHFWLTEKVDFKMKTVVDMPSYMKLLEEEVTEAEYERGIKYTASNVRYVKKDGKFFRQGSYQTFRATHQEATQHKLTYKLSSMMMTVSQKIQNWHHSKKHTAKQEFGLQYGDMMCSKIIAEAEEKSANVCESCGGELGQSKVNKRCVTRGWIKNLCPACAERSGEEFFIDGELHKGQKCILSKEETQQKFGEQSQ